MYFLICIDVIFEQLHQTHENDITDLIKYVATPNTGLKMFLSLISFRNGPSTKFWPVLLTRSPVLANTSSCFSVIYFLICADVIFVVAPKHDSDITDLVEYVATPEREHAQDVSLAHIIQKWTKYPSTKNVMCLL